MDFIYEPNSGFLSQTAFGLQFHKPNSVRLYSLLAEQRSALQL